ncbi:mannitol dehydrogenase family protein [Demequina aestuarii]|uniref:mannitol dehydrogenase family protein n=1 Tax=Demequina aestuarii TaxID=327095 RepID=UPI000781B720|nr:mannitol dehydrogenase family protein [Demequina aestuarii]
MTSLSPHALADLAPHVRRPEYDRAAVRIGIVHIGVGGFHRSHEALYVDRLLAADPQWGICGVGVRPADAEMRDALVPQHGLYTLTTVDPHGAEEVRVVGSLVKHLHAPDDPEAVLQQMADPAVRIVSLTITEGGYGIDDATGDFSPPDEATREDMEGTGTPSSAFGLISEALRRRRDNGVAPFAVVSCDNVQHNGSVARKALIAVAHAREPELARWIADEVSFPNSMVDRITPGTTEETRRAVASDIGLEDRWPVRAESFLQWVLEDDFPAGSPAWEDAGVQLVTDVEPYELMKLRLLNASHQVMSYPALLAGLTWVDEACRDPQIVALLSGWMREARATLAPVPGVDLDQYCETLIQRFGSRAVRDTVARQVVNSSDRLPKFVVPVLAARGSGALSHHGLFAVAAWSAWLAEALPTAGEGITDTWLDLLLATAAREEAGDVGVLLDIEPIFGALGRDADARDAYWSHRARIREHGVRSALTSLLTGVAPARDRSLS